VFDLSPGAFALQIFLISHVVSQVVFPHAEEVKLSQPSQTAITMNKFLLHLTGVAVLCLALVGCDSALVDTDTDVNLNEPQTVGKQDKTSVCHYNAEDDAYYLLEVGGGGLEAHLAHGDLPFDNDPGDVDPTDGDGIYCVSQPASHDAPGWIVFESDRSGDYEIYAMDADGSNQKNLTQNPGGDYEAVVSPDGSKIAFTSDRDGDFEIYVMNADGSNAINITNNTTPDQSPSWSPDGSQIVFIAWVGGYYQVYVMDADGGNRTRLTYTEPSHDGDPSFSPDGSKIVLTNNSGLTPNIYVIDADGSNRTNLSNGADWDFDPAWSPDGSQIVFRREIGGNDEIYLMNADGSGQTNLTNSADNEEEPVFSLDGAQVAFTSDRDGNDEVYMMNLDGSSLTNLTDNPANDARPFWAPEP